LTGPRALAGSISPIARRTGGHSESISLSPQIRLLVGFATAAFAATTASPAALPGDPAKGQQVYSSSTCG
jgi:hypothetical protein